MSETPSPGERRLSHPPSDRYRVAEPPPPAPDTGASRKRGIAFGAIAGFIGAAAITILGGVLAISAGLLVVAAATGWAVALGVRVGAGSRLDRRGRVRPALTVAIVAIALGQAGLWLYGRSEGGVLAPIDYLWEVFGFLVPLEFGAAALAAWITAR